MARLPTPNTLTRFEQAALPHLDAAYNLARWLMGDGHEADDAVQEAYLRALRYADSYHGNNARAWLLAIVRNTCYTLLRARRARGSAVAYDEKRHGADGGPAPDAAMLRQEDSRLVHQALEELPVEAREVVVLRELEGLSYKEIAGVTGVPLGTVMSRLSRAREQLLEVLVRRGAKEG
jgi:RNA polymerase sigma-70 factor (ECF subfamily)